MGLSFESEDGVFIESPLAGGIVYLPKTPRLASEPVPTDDKIDWTGWPFPWSTWPLNEIGKLAKEAETNPTSARRLAELLEWVRDFRAAKQAWKHAAELGDQDAILYYAGIIESPETERAFEEQGRIPDPCDDEDGESAND